MRLHHGYGPVILMRMLLRYPTKKCNDRYGGRWEHRAAWIGGENDRRIRWIDISSAGAGHFPARWDPPTYRKMAGWEWSPKPAKRTPITCLCDQQQPKFACEAVYQYTPFCVNFETAWTCEMVGLGASGRGRSR